MLHTSFPTERATRYETPIRYYPCLRSHRWQYIETFATHRRRESSGDDDMVRDFDEVRNGLFVDSTIHCVLGRHLAFLKVRLFNLVLHMLGS
jgi:hypothetical protein